MSTNQHADQFLHNPYFRFREKEITRIIAQWEVGESVLLTGIRRTGKSELMKAALWRYAQDGHRVAYIDVQQEDNLARFYESLLIKVLENSPASLGIQWENKLKSLGKFPDILMGWFRKHVHKVDVPAIGGIEFQAPDEQLRRYWEPLTNEIATLLGQQQRSDLPVLGIDELPFMVENLMEAGTGITTQDLKIMLASLRVLRDAGLRLIIGGSISFENILSLYNIPHTVLGGLFRMPVVPFNRQEADLYLQETLKGRFSSTAPAITLILDTLPDYVPEVLKITKGFLLSCESINECEYSLTNEVMPAVRRSFLEQFAERLRDNYRNESLVCAQLILDLIATGDAVGVKLNGQQLPADYQRVLSLLQYDNFIVDAPDFSWRFSLSLIRLWWRGTRGIV